MEVLVALVTRATSRRTIYLGMLPTNMALFRVVEVAELLLLSCTHGSREKSSSGRPQSYREDGLMLSSRPRLTALRNSDSFQFRVQSLQFRVQPLQFRVPTHLALGSNAFSSGFQLV